MTEYRPDLGASPIDVTTRCVSSSADFASLRQAWDDLLDRSPFPHCFLTWEWLYTWWQCYARDSWRLRIQVVCRDDDIIGIAPFYIQPVRRLGMTMRLLAFLGTQEDEADEACSMYMDIIAAEDDRQLVAHCVATRLGSGSDRWDEAVFSNLLNDSMVLTELNNALVTHANPTRRTVTGARYLIDLPATMEDYIASLSSKRREETRRNTRKLNSEGKLRGTVLSRNDELASAWDEMLHLHFARWHSRGLPGAFASPVFSAFHKRLLPVLLERGWLQLYFVELNGRNICVSYNITYGDTLFSYLSGFDYEKHSPGLLNNMMAIEHAIDCKLKRFDFLKGEAGSYKSAYGAQALPLFDLAVYSHSGKGHTMQFADTLRQWLHKIKQRITS